MNDTSASSVSAAPEHGEEQRGCPECGGTEVVEPGGDGELVCKGCGLILEAEAVDDREEWRAFTQRETERKARAGEPVTYTRHDMGVSTEIGSGAGELSTVAGKKRAQYARMQQWHSRITGSKNRNLGFAFSELKRLASQLGLAESVQEEAARLYEKAVDKELVKGRSMEGVLTAIVYAVARTQGTPRTLEEIGEASGIEARDIGRTYRYVARELGLDIKPAEPEDYLPRFASELQVSGRVQVRARTLIEQARDANLLAGKGRTGIAAAALYTAAVLEKETRTQDQVADAAGVTVVTLRNRYQELMDAVGLGDAFGGRAD
jgi:transcription initiation factor TFIIB